MTTGQPKIRCSRRYCRNAKSCWSGGVLRMLVLAAIVFCVLARWRPGPGAGGFCRGGHRSAFRASGPRTRVVLDLDRSVTYESRRGPSPTRPTQSISTQVQWQRAAQCRRTARAGWLQAHQFQPR